MASELLKYIPKDVFNHIVLDYLQEDREFWKRRYGSVIFEIKQLCKNECLEDDPEDERSLRHVAGVLAAQRLLRPGFGLDICGRKYNPFGHRLQGPWFTLDFESIKYSTVGH